MAETLITPSESNTQADGVPDPPNTVGSIVTRKIDFQLAKKPFAGFSNGGVGFRLETLNPSSSDPHKLGQSNPGNAQSGRAGKRGDGSEFLDAGLDPEISFGINFRRILKCFLTLPG
ncbi:hypothetical protein Acr_00g0017550 [Actinidia rufa]|uniref:Uncharacterized protein n=1 Tax=Actinidia rufa TaxID=165716 RepID=A0A7J0DD07_9ERIC|nr:hypothetical protein Acr_00g0017550 [Actinidia rufa]